MSDQSQEETKTEIYKNKRYMEEGDEKMRKIGYKVANVKEIKRGKGKTGKLPNSYIVTYKKYKISINPIVTLVDKTKKKLKEVLVG